MADGVDYHEVLKELVSVKRHVKSSCLVMSTSSKLRQTKIEFSEILTAGDDNEKIKIYAYANHLSATGSQRWDKSRGGMP